MSPLPVAVQLCSCFEPQGWRPSSIIITEFSLLNLIPTAPAHRFVFWQQSLEGPPLEGNESFSDSSPVIYRNVAENLRPFSLISAKRPLV